MKKLIRNTFLSLAVAAGALTVSAQNSAPLIKGYFRIQNVGNEKFVEVTGPFTAKPDKTAAEAEKSAGTIMYVEAVQDGDSYRLTHLRCQGIDVVSIEEDIDPAEYSQVISNILEGGDLDSSLAYALVRKGFQYGYTSIARATIGTVFYIVGSKLGGWDNEDGKDYTPQMFEELVNRFNETVTAKLDLGIRLKPVDVENKTVQVYFDVPSLEPVCKWYAQDENHDLFTAATKAMTNFLASRDITLETFYEPDITLFNSWGYDLTEKFGVNDGTITTTFETIFSDPILLFNWVKWVGYMILTPQSESAKNHNMSRLGFGDLASGAQNHYLTSLLVDYLPRLHYNTRAFLIDGRVGEADKFGGAWDESKSGTLGFASELEMGTADTHGEWKLFAVDNKTAPTGTFTPELRHTATDVDDESGKAYQKYSGFYFDFPISAVDAPNTKFYNLSEQILVKQGQSQGTDYYVQYLTLDEMPTDEDGVIEAQKAFLVTLAVEGERVNDYIPLNVGDGECIFEALAPTAPQQPENSFVIDDNEETVKQYTVGKTRLVTDKTSSAPLQGIMLETPYNEASMNNYWGLTDPYIYPLTIHTPASGSSKRYMAFQDNGQSVLGANTVVYATEQPLNYDKVYIGEPDEEQIPTGVEAIETDNSTENDGAFYDLRGIKVDKPLRGNLYIHNGKKVLVL